MTNFTIGDRVRIASTVHQLPLDLTGVVTDFGPIPNSFMILMDNDGTENCWFGTHLERVK